MADNKPELLSTGKLAEKIGISPAKVKKAIEELMIEPDAKRGVCLYFSPEAAEKIKTHLGLN